MSTYTENNRKVTVSTILSMKQQGEKIAMLTAYDYTMATLLDQGGVDIILVGDSAANVMAGYTTTLPITIDEMIYHARSVRNGAQRALIAVDMPFGSCSGNPMQSLANAVRMMKESGADALKIEGGVEVADDIKKIIDAGIPVIGHLGLMPQSINKYGSYGVRAKGDEEAEKLINDTLLLEKIGCFAIVLEKIPATLAQKIAQSVKIPIIGIGAGAGVDGQVLVVQDMLGMNKAFAPKFLRRYADLHTVIMDAVGNYISDVKSSDFPNEKESY